MSATVRLRGVEFAYPDGTSALNGVDLVIETGERVAILGPNGGGKTTLALHLNGILAPEAGSLTVGDLPVVEANYPEIRRMVGLVFQDPNDQLFMPTVREDVAFGPANLGLTGDDLEKRVETALDVVAGRGFADRPPHHLSGGEKRRAALATVLAMEPEVVVFDEPSSGLDPAGRRELIETLSHLPMTQLLITHDLPLALELCPRSVIMNQGRIVADAPTRELLRDAELLAANRLEAPYGFERAEHPPLT
ncbi:MAG TPA: ABC transporter ATP-binding protein [Acidimicrobiia bacterium]|nr:ABC transporter ATP-binding protein [Acidimicrobiia bacterium]